MNLNFTSPEAIDRRDQAGLKTIISARLLGEATRGFPWTPNVIHLDQALPPLKLKILAWWIAGIITLPRCWLRS